MIARGQWRPTLWTWICGVSIPCYQSNRFIKFTWATTYDCVVKNMKLKHWCGFFSSVLFDYTNSFSVFSIFGNKTKTLKLVAIVSAIMTSCRLQKWKIKVKETKVTQNTGDNGGFCSATLRWFYLVVLSRVPRDFILSQALYCGELWYSFSASA